MLRASGFVASGRTWRKRMSSAVLVVNLQQSNDVLLVNLGVCIQELTAIDSPLIQDCHISFRLERVCPSQYFEAVRSASPGGGREDFIVALERFGIPWLEALATRAGMRDFLQSPVANRGLVTAAVRAWAGEGLQAE